MILDTGFDSIIESIVLKDSLSYELSEASTIVNPKSEYYFDKIIIVSMPTDLKILEKCVSNRCRILSRFPLDVNFQYFLKPYPDSIGIELKFIGNSHNFYNKNYYRSIRCLRNENSIFIYEPKGWDDTEVKGYPTMLGFVKSLCKRV